MAFTREEKACLDCPLTKKPAQWGCAEAARIIHHLLWQHHPALDALYKQELSTVDPVKRGSIFFQIHQIDLTELPFIVLFSPTDIGMVRKETHNYQISPFSDGETAIWEWWCDGGKC